MTEQELIQSLQGIGTTPLNDKINKLAARTNEKVARLGLDNNTYGSTVLGKTSGRAFYDADSPYQTNQIKDSSKSKTLRIGNIDSSLNSYVNAPEAPSTIERSQNRKATPEEIATYRASMVAKDNFAMGTTPATAEQFQELIANPLTPENQVLYDQAMKDVYANTDNTIDLRGLAGKEGIRGRQIVQAYNPTAPDPTESLQNRLLETGNADMYSYGKPIAQLEDNEVDNVLDQLAGDSNKGIGNALAGFGYTLGEGIINTADLVAEGAEYAFKNIVGDGQSWSDTEGLYDKKDSETFKKWTGYNEQVLNELGQEATTAIKNAWEKGDYWGLVETLGKAALTPELAGASLGYVAGLAMPGSIGKRVVDAVSGVNKVAKAMMAADKTGKLTKAAAFAEASKDAGVGYKIATIMAGNTGYVAGAEQFGRDAEELYKEIYNEEMPTAQKLAIRPLGMLFVKMDSGIAKALLLGKDPIAKAIPEMIAKLPNQMKATIAGKVAVLAGVSATRVAGAFGLESSTEAIQTSMEKVAGKYKSGEVGVMDVLEEEKYDIGGAGLLGAAGGVQFAAPTIAKDAVTSGEFKGTLATGARVAKKLVEKATETPEQKISRENLEYTEPLKAEASDRMASNETDKVVVLVDSIHGKVSNDLDESAPKKFTYGIVIRDAMDKAITSGDEAAIRNVYKTIGELDSREDIEFSAADVIEERTYRATQEFVTLINSGKEVAEGGLSDLVAKQAAETVVEAGTQIDKNILAKVKAMQESLEKDREAAKSVMGSDSYGKSGKSADRLIQMMKEYTEGKGLDSVNSEVGELGYIQMDVVTGALKADPNRPGIKAYETELTNQLMNPKSNKNLLNEKVATSGAGPTLNGLLKFSESRVSKLGANKNRDAYQTGALIGSQVAENTKMIESINKLKDTAAGLKGLDKATKESYEAILDEAYNNARTANEILTGRKEVLDKLVSTESGKYAYQIGKDGKETIQLVKGKNNKLEVAIVEDGVVKWIGEAPKQTDTQTTAQPDEVINNDEFKDDTETKIEPEEVEDTAEVEIVKPKIAKKLTKIDKSKYTKALKWISDTIDEEVGKGNSIPTAVAAVKKLVKAEGISEEKVALYDKLITEVVKDKVSGPKKTPLDAVRAKIDKVSEELAKEIESVDDMQVKAHVKKYYKAKLNEINKDRTKLSKIVDRMITELGKRTGTKQLGKLKKMADLLVKGMVKALNQLKKRLKLADKRHDKLTNELSGLLNEINKIEEEYLEANEIKPEEVKTSIGKVKKYADSAYGPMAEAGNKRADARIALTKAGKSIQNANSAMGDAMDALKTEAIAELDKEIEETGSLGAKLLKRNLERYSLTSVLSRMIKRGKDSVFGKMGKDMFADPDKLIEALPKSFKEFFIADEESRAELIDNFDTMDRYIKGTAINTIKLEGKTIEGNVDRNGVVMYSEVLYRPIEADESVEIGDTVVNIAAKKAEKLAEAEDKKNGRQPRKRAKLATKVTADNVNEINSSRTKYEIKKGDNSSFPVDIIELIGTVNDKGVLEIDEQTETILKFYSAKMATDSQAMIGNILRMDESEMAKYLGITDADEQARVKEDAANGWVNSSGIRKDIGSEVYQALGLKLDRSTPEFTEESFKSALGVLVQAIVVDNGTMEMKTETTAGKTQNIVKLNSDKLTDKLKGKTSEDLTKAINKLQYLNENRNRPLPSFKAPERVEYGKRVVMNTSIVVDEETNKKMNDTEAIGYTISDRLAKYLKMDENEVLKAMGYKDVENSGLHISEMSAQQARNDKLVREWDILKTFARASKSKKFYIPWGQTVSGRYTMLSDIQYQESKLHREFVVAEGGLDSVDVKDADNRQMLEASVLQGLDMDPDKLSPETATEKFNDVFEVTDEGIKVKDSALVKDDGKPNSKNIAIKKAYEAMLDGKLDSDAMAEVFHDSEGHHGISSIELLVDWDSAIKSGKELKTHANVEIDAITSGMILTLLQIGTDIAIRMAEKGGIYTAERMPELKEYVEKWLPGKTFTPGALIEAGKKHAAEIEDKMKTAKGAELVALRKELEEDSVFKDLYSTIGVAMIGEVQAKKTELENNSDRTPEEELQLAMLEEIGKLNLKNIRSIAKSPVMVYIYGASIGSIKNKLTYSLGVETLVKAIKKGNTEFVNRFIPDELKQYKDRYGAKIDTEGMSAAEKLLHLDISELVITSIGKVIDATFGKAIELAFDSRLGFVDKNRDAVKAVEMLTFEAYKIKLSEAIKAKLDDAYGIGKHNGESYKLSKDDLVLINSELTKQGYGHTLIWKKEGRKDRNQSLQKTSNKGGTHSSRVTVGDTSVGGQIKEAKAVVNTGAASTIPIHAVDGDMILEVLNRELAGELAGKYTGGNVYDAVVLGINKAMLTDTADYYNTNMIDTGFNRSIMADQLEKLEAMLEGFEEDQFELMINSIGLRPEGDGRVDYAKEENRLKLSVGKMLERIELAEKLNVERLANSEKAYGSGHLYQMGSGVVDVEKSSKSRAKAFPATTKIKALLTARIEKDRKQTAEEFGNKLNDGVDYVMDLQDFVEGKNRTKSKANFAQFKVETVEGKIKFRVTDKLWPTFTSRDLVQVLGGDHIAVGKVLKPKDKDADKPSHGNSAKWHLDTIVNALADSDASIVDDTNDWSESGRTKVDGVWVKPKEDTIPESKKAIIAKLKELHAGGSINSNMKKLMTQVAREVAEKATNSQRFSTAFAEIIKECK